MAEEREPRMEEKEEEKVHEKEEEKVDEKGSSDPLSAVIFALILIWGGVILLAHNFGFLEAFEGLVSRIPAGRLDLPWEQIWPLWTMTALSRLCLPMRGCRRTWAATPAGGWTTM